MSIQCNLDKSLQVARLIIMQLSLKEQAAAVAGGCPRDLYFGLPVRDVDVVVAFESKFQHQSDEYQAEVMLLELGRIIQSSGIPHVRTLIMERYELEGDPHRLLGVMKITSEHGVSVDVIVYSDEFVEGRNTIQGVVKQFDSNINQFILTETGPKCVATNPLSDGLVFYTENDVTEKRMIKSQAYYAEVSSVVPHLVANATWGWADND